MRHPGVAMAGARAITKAVRDDAYTAARHLRGGRDVEKSLRKGKEAHVFNDGVDLKALEQRVWTEGRYAGRVGAGRRAEFDRFVWRSDTPIGTRIQDGKPDVPLHWVEIEGKIVNGDWAYHLVPRPRPA